MTRGLPHNPTSPRSKHGMPNCSKERSRSSVSVVLPLVEALEVVVDPIVLSLRTYVGSSHNMSYDRESHKRYGVMMMNLERKRSK
ncbi:hypothetical protein K443DRAFT_542784 [Laccaria amethystina LaAM-08-1]|uniref:Uncharacterized protein n=1 Tax=Laccaria amethystina LaAM-08-1 TaxID=1095629 RepID=A0A0C9WT18_9AGAR|nr:hypothetical protein K443DRAFT_542784 [Laccaria amethystina LaAM-08-1]